MMAGINKFLKLELVLLAISLYMGVDLTVSEGVCPYTCDCGIKYTVNCNTSQFSKVPFDLPANTVVLDLQGNNIHAVRTYAFAGLKNLTQIILSDLPMNDTGLNRHSFGGVQRLDVLDLSGNHFQHFPKFLPPTISTLYVLDNSISQIRKEDFANFSHISVLFISYNKIKSIEPDAFNVLRNSLVQLELEFNKLTCNATSGGLVFSNLYKMSSFGMRLNPFDCIPANLPVALTGLDAVGIGLKSLEYGTINHLTNLIGIGLWQNGIEKIADNSFVGLDKVTLLDANTNNISVLNNMTLKGLSSLKQVYLYLNKIKTITTGAFQGMKNLTELWLSDNLLTTLDQGLIETFKQPSLTYIDISDNPFICDCKLRWLKQFQEESSKIQLPHMMICSAPPTLQGKTWDKLSYKNFTC